MWRAMIRCMLVTIDARFFAFISISRLAIDEKQISFFENLLDKRLRGGARFLLLEETEEVESFVTDS
jgi:hypothetical protein